MICEPCGKDVQEHAGVACSDCYVEIITKNKRLRGLLVKCLDPLEIAIIAKESRSMWATSYTYQELALEIKQVMEGGRE